MTIFDLLFLLCAIATLLTSLWIGVCGLRGRGDQALRLLRNWVICAALYAAASVAVAYPRPQPIMRVGDPWCFDDWCMRVVGVVSTPRGETTSYVVAFRIYSTAKRISQRASGAWIYLIDPQGHRYSPIEDPAATPLDAQLAPEQSLETSRTFEVPASVHEFGLITGHGGSYCSPMSLLIIGQGGCMFHKPTMVRIR
jgi:hypothetical protein